MRALHAILCACGALMLMSVPGVWVWHEAHEASAPPKSELLTGGLADSLKRAAKRPFTLSATQLSSSPPTQFDSKEELQCSDAPWTLKSASGKRVVLSLESDERAIWLLMVWLCEPYPVKTLNEARGHLDPDDRAILADADGFSYRLGAQKKSHMVVDFELERVESITFQPSKKSTPHHLVATRREGEKDETIMISVSEGGKLRWTAKVKRSKGK